MKDFRTWLQDYEGSDKPFLVVGKGPSFSAVDSVNAGEYNIVSLNHAVRELAVDFAHVIDIDVIEQCESALRKNARYLLMPNRPHIDSKPTTLSLDDICETIEVLKDFRDQGRLLTYQLWAEDSDRRMLQGTFSGSVVVNLLAEVGVKSIRAAGVDGGAQYSSVFKDLSDVSLFKNKHSSFDVQTQEILDATRESGVDYQALSAPIRICIGSDQYQVAAAETLEYSIRKHASQPVEIFHMSDLDLPEPKYSGNRPGTGFSFYRFVIPKLMGYSGKAIYLDADMLVFGDIAELWNIPMSEKLVQCSTQTEVPAGWENGDNNSLGEDRYWQPGRQLSVMLLDCERLTWEVEEIIQELDEGKYTYAQLMNDLVIVPDELIGEDIPNEWNCLEWYEEGRSRLVHFTVVPTQPWRHETNRLNALWETGFKDALDAGAINLDSARKAVAEGLLKPSLIELIDNAPKQENRTPQNTSSEVERLRSMLWQSMNESNVAKRELAAIRTYPFYWFEELLVRRPLRFLARAARWLLRRLR